MQTIPSLGLSPTLRPSKSETLESALFDELKPLLVDISDHEQIFNQLVQSLNPVVQTAKEVQSEFRSLLSCLNQLPKETWPRHRKDRLLQLLLTEAICPGSPEPRCHFLLRHQFNRIFLKRRKVEYLLYRLSCVIVSENGGPVEELELECSLSVFSSLLPVQMITSTRHGAALLSGDTTWRGKSTDQIVFKFRFNDITANLPGGVLALAIRCSGLGVKPLIIPNVTVKSLKKQFRFTN